MKKKIIEFIVKIWFVLSFTALFIGPNDNGTQAEFNSWFWLYICILINFAAACAVVNKVFPEDKIDQKSNEA